jgi:hypothetical protein
MMKIGKQIMKNKLCQIDTLSVFINGCRGDGSVFTGFLGRSSPWHRSRNN